MTRCSLTCGNKKKQWGNSNGNYGTYIMSDVGGKSFVMGVGRNKTNPHSLLYSEIVLI
jgi:hypothetical protein